MGGLQNWIDELWSRGDGWYIGEWHYHPGGRPVPSIKDQRQMFQIAGTDDAHCPEPVLLMVGGRPGGMPFGASGFVPGRRLILLKADA